MPGYVWSVRVIILLGPGSFWGVASRTQHRATWFKTTGVFFKPIKSLKPNSKNRDNGRINI